MGFPDVDIHVAVVLEGAVRLFPRVLSCPLARGILSGLFEMGSMTPGFRGLDGGVGVSVAVRVVE